MVVFISNKVEKNYAFAKAGLPQQPHYKKQPFCNILPHKITVFLQHEISS
ncbi:hypothetical protein NMS_2270 [Nonlabens marinus S1-08]|uniref:Uncharacterized protein n=1 Tax=Nonlabens marinus S1-08 TaxID=1454201 RepID=W8VRI6_9FLAO|nr:hypothetical protein NMS_2270 [Nonlabens marinus S1-08]